MRACELHAIAIQDRVFLGGQHPDPVHAARREGAFFVAVNCGQAASTCFCVSMSAGPKAGQGFDLALTELIDDNGHRFLVETGTSRGEEVIGEIPGALPAGSRDTEVADDLIERTAAQMGRATPAMDLRDLLYGNLEKISPAAEETAK